MTDECGLCGVEHVPGICPHCMTEHWNDPHFCSFCGYGTDEVLAVGLYLVADDEGSIEVLDE